ncbi:3-hydroxyacyl-ACP dehydratase FabZ [Lichenihabitans sp. Uapishka_5]|uniref:3-hydroxyacyl-ACP dehydratase FabZ n=1 Tax=Lichenihabitans sp. Uapishka_5 TaxID=3037302 RepID=UPI0029E816B6|nr:3-hydroxyacyl-ACP dehydratase FabZ [Lichenihabitans sp. Uapishka_5]MDX7951999.1 3-hydroxyacyl-ACP dehydratase FabZ [Lichenihabitans sp. Uapishka_5]
MTASTLSPTTTTDGGSLATMDILALLASLPHRYPFLMVDRIRDIQDDLSCVGIKQVTFNEPQFQGHFPGAPVMPGVLLIEGMAQTAGAICVRAQGVAKPKLVYFMTIDKAKFRKPVVPGDTVEYHLTRINKRRTMWWYKGEAKVDGVVVCEAEISAMLVMNDADA